MKEITAIIMIFGLALVQAQVGINTETPQATLDIKSSGDSFTTKALKISNKNNIDMVAVTDDGRVGIGTTSPKQKLEVIGSIKVGNSGDVAPQGTIRFNGSRFQACAKLGGCREGSHWADLHTP